MEYTSRLIFVGDIFQIGEWRCFPDSRLWAEENIAGHQPMIVFPHSAVQIQHSGRDLIVTSPNQVVFYNKDQTYRRGLASRQGDICEYVYIDPEIVAELQYSLGIHRCDDIHSPFRQSQGPCCTQAFLIQRSICNLIASQQSEPLLIEESFMSILPGLLLDSDRTSSHSKPAKPATSQHRRLQVEMVKEYLNRHMSEAVALSDLAEACDTSAFHISRVFKEQTGTTIFQYLISLRLRTAFEHVIDTKSALAWIAVETGFSSQSHMSNLFKREFGVTPNCLRLRRPVEIIRRFLKQVDNR